MTGSVEPAATLSFSQYLRQWSQIHDGVDPNANWLIRWWLRVAYVVAKPFALMRVSPNAMTMLGLLVSITIPFVAAYGIATQATALLWLATLLIPVAGLIDSLDGAVAVMTGRTSRFGYVLDSVCDRISEIAITATLIIVGGQWVPVMAAILLGFLLEYERSRVRAIEGDWDAPLTLAERPTRLIIVGVFLGLATLAPFGIAAATWATVGAVVAALVAAIGVAQLSHTSYRHLR